MRTARYLCQVVTKLGSYQRIFIKVRNEATCSVRAALIHANRRSRRIWCLLDRASLWLLTNKKPTRCHLLLLFYFLETQHVSGINKPIFRSLRLCCWTTILAVSFLTWCVLESGCGSAGVVCGLLDAGSLDTTLAGPHPHSNTQQIKNETANVVSLKLLTSKCTYITFT